MIFDDAPARARFQITFERFKENRYMPHAPLLFAPFRLGGLTLPNRIAVSPMCQYVAIDGFADDWHLVHLGSRAVGGAGLVIVEATAVTPEGRITPGDLGLWKDEQIAPLARIVRFLHAQGAYAGIQIAHAGRKASMCAPWLPEQLLTPEQGGWTDIAAPSAIPFASHYAQPQGLTLDGIDRLVEAFVATARRALKAGFDLLEIHAAHGYLLHEFLSPLANHRIDEYGGSFENRTRLLVRVVDAVREVWPLEQPLLVRISATDWVDDPGVGSTPQADQTSAANGASPTARSVDPGTGLDGAASWTIGQSVALAKVLKKRGVEMIDVSSGGMVPHAKIPSSPGYQVPFAARIRAESGIATAAVGLITTAPQAEQIVAAGEADLVLLAREFLREPYWPLVASAELGANQSWPVPYHRAAPRGAALREPLAGLGPLDEIVGRGLRGWDGSLDRLVLAAGEKS
jgi:2,4-dienoyl-CoA reductase-like NADH-dependent reductase (Old Yellow Enzyme family)